jgi:phosphatidylinositol alpha-1,6-mannosyltransferase
VPSEPRVLFVSKPIAPPWNDGSKNLVRDLAVHLTRARPTVMTTAGVAPLGPRVRCEAVYRDPGRFAPGLRANARVVDRLLRGDPQDIWHFVFAPNPVSATAAQLARRARALAGWRGKVVQTVASAPRTFEGVNRWMFGDVVVALSEWTRGRLMGAGVDASTLRVIPPFATPPREVTDAERAAVRARWELGDGPVVLYPGDYEVSRGAETVARAVPRIARAFPEARVVFACRAKTPRAAEAASRVRDALRAANVAQVTRHLGEVDDMPALLSTASVVAFPVDDLYAKVDLPLVLLESLALGLPLVLARGGPLEAIDTARFVDPGDADALAGQVLDLLRTPSAVTEQRDAGRALYEARFRPSVVAAAYDELYAELAP